MKDSSTYGFMDGGLIHKVEDWILVSHLGG